MKRPWRPRDAIGRAKYVVDLATGAVEGQKGFVPENETALTKGMRLGGEKGGRARAANMSPKQRSEAASKAAKARWKKSALTGSKRPK